jgi:hypothetical protein
MTTYGIRLGFFWQLLRHSGQRRHALRWWSSYRPGFLLENRLPWLVFDAIDALAGLDLAGRKVFEYGSGGSTLFWQDRGAAVVAVEHDPAWFAVVRSRLKPTPPVDYRLSPPQPTASGCGSEPADPTGYRSADPVWRDACFQRYVTVIDDFRDGSFDVVLVDGRARPSCIKHGAKKVTAGGALILDDSQRPYYLAKTTEYLRDFVESRFLGPRPAVHGISATSIFTRRP